MALGGVMVAAKTDRAHDGLVAQFQARTVERAYGALVWGVPQPLSGRMTGNIGRSPRNRKKMAVLAHGGRPAATNYKVIRAFGSAAAELQCRLESGRTHQIRVHMAHIDHPLVGDPVYGGRLRLPAGAGTELTERLRAFKRQALHAEQLKLRHPVSEQAMHWQSPLPPDMRELLAALEEDNRHQP